MIFKLSLEQYAIREINDYNDKFNFNTLYIYGEG